MGRYDGIAESMLAVMSFGLLAQHTAAPAFNGLFYATAATIMPVLFLALVVQDPHTAKCFTVSGSPSWLRFQTYSTSRPRRRLDSSKIREERSW